MNSVNREKFLVILDADDTIWWVEELYDMARSEARSLVEAAGLDGSLWEAIERRLDVLNVSRFGLSSNRFPASCVEAYDDLIERTSAQNDAELRNAIENAARAVFYRPARLVDGAHDALDGLSGVAMMALLTKGEREVQERRLAESGLKRYFDQVHIVDLKDERAFQSVLVRFAVPHGNAWSIGNSLASDILPAVSAGMRAVWVEADVWEYEKRQFQSPADDRIARAADLTSASEAVVDSILKQGCIDYMETPADS